MSSKHLIKTLGLALVAALAVSAVAIASASAHEFAYSGTVPTKLNAKVAAGTAGEQVFTAGFGSVTCKVLKTSMSPVNEIKSAKTTEQLAIIEYSSCSTSVLGDTVAEPIKAEYKFIANEEVEVVKTVEFTLEGSTACTVEVTGPKKYGGIKYVNKGTELEIQANVSGISYTSKGNILCGSGSTATYKGNSLASGASGGTLSWS